jgi:EmrB/QacA subfamily drug resistance transporter
VARKWWTLIAVCVGVFMLLLDITIVVVALPSIGRAFNASLADLQWVIDAYALTLAAFLLTAGTISDRVGRRLVFAVGIVIFTGGSLACGFAQGPLFLALARGAQGVGGAIMFATTLALLAQAFRGKERGVAFGAFGAISGVAIAVGPVLGGLITSGLSWRWIFFVNVPIGIVALLITLTRIDESRDPRPRRVDWVGFVSFSGGLAALVYGLIRSSEVGWSSATVIGSLAAAAVLLAIFLVAELRQRDPMFDMHLTRVPTFDGGLVAAWAISASLFSLLTYLVLWIQDVLGLSAIASGLRFLPLSGALFVAATLAGRLTSVVPIRYLISAGFVLIGTGLWLMRGLTASSGWSHLLAGMIVSGIGAGLVNVPLAATAVGVVEPERAGMASGINSTLRQVGIATGIAVLGTVFASRLRDVVVSHLSGTPLSAQAHQIATAVSSGRAGQTLATLPPALRGSAGLAARSGFVAGLNLILLVGVVICGAGAVLTFALIRKRDFVAAAVGETLVEEPGEERLAA